jgi:hypothetical protein
MSDRGQRCTPLLCRLRPQATGVDLAGIGGVTQDAADGRLIPASVTARGQDPECHQVFGDAVQALPGFEVGREDLSDCGRLASFHPHASGITGMVRMHTIARGRARPRQEQTRPLFHQPAPTHALGNQCPFVLGDRPADLQQELIVGVVAHGAVQKLDLTAAALKFFQQEHLMGVLPGQPIRRCDQHPIQGPLRHRIAQAI